MTDTVNVPEAIERLASVANGAGVSDVYGGEWCINGPASFRADLSAVLAAAPKAEPVGMAALDRLFYGGKAYIGAEEAVRQIVGLQAELAALRAQPEAPKVEQEPVAYVNRKGFTTGGLVWTKEGRDADLPDETKLYTHPAPASDELQSFADFIADEAHNLDLTKKQLELVKASFRALIGRYNAKHKGPQS